MLNASVSFANIKDENNLPGCFGCAYAPLNKGLFFSLDFPIQQKHTLNIKIGGFDVNPSTVTPSSPPKNMFISWELNYTEHLGTQKNESFWWYRGLGIGQYGRNDLPTTNDIVPMYYFGSLFIGLRYEFYLMNISGELYGMAGKYGVNGMARLVLQIDADYIKWIPALPPINMQ